MPIISLDNVYKSYGQGLTRVKVLEEVSLQIEQGEFVALVGASGSGKSTLMNILGLLDRPDSGTYAFKDQDVGKLKDRDLARIRRENIGFVFQSFNLVARLSARSNVELPMIYDRTKRRDRRFQSERLLKLVGLQDRAKNKPSQLSGGQLQRVAIARALANRPGVILADEPTGNLDSRTGTNVMKMLSKLNKRGNTILLITHDPKVAQYADRILTIKDGRVKSARRKRQQAIKAPAGTRRKA